MANIMSAVEQGFFNTAATKRMKELEARQSELERLIIIERSKAEIKVSEKDIRAFYEAALLQEPLMLINYLIKEITVYDDAVHITFNSPLQTSPDESWGFSFCDRETYIPVHVQNSLEMKKQSVKLTMSV